MKIGLTKIILINLIIATFLYIFLFIIYPGNSSYFECNQLVENNLFNSQISYSIPVSCDQELYLVGVYDFQSIYTFDYNYQTRPLYILLVKIFYDILNILLSNSLIIKFLSFNLTHLFIISISTKVFFDSLERLKILINNKSKILLSLFIFLTPIIKWGFYDSSHQTLTFLHFSLSFYFLVYKFTDYKKIYLYSFLLGLLALSNMTFILPLIFLIFYKINSIDKFFINFGNNLFAFLLFIIPVLSWNLFIIYEGFDPYNAAIEYWNQFIWIIHFFKDGTEMIAEQPGVESAFCMSVPLFIKCYLVDFSRSLLYLFNLVVLLLGTYKYVEVKEKELYISLLKKLLIVFLVSFFFWSFIGWYPPLRFTLYSLGSFLTLLFCIQFIFINNNKIRNLSASSYFLYFLFLNHWNFEGIIKINIGLSISILLSLYIAFEYVYKTTLKR